MVVYDFDITRVIDGDTVAFAAPFLPEPLKQELSIRVYGVDTPEKVGEQNVKQKLNGAKKQVVYKRSIK